MEQQDLNIIAENWDQKAQGWDSGIGTEGDYNRTTSSDPVLFSYLGDVSDKVVLDAGCGTGYLGIKIAKQGAKQVFSVDLSPKMVEITKKRIEQSPVASKIDARVDSITELRTIGDESVDLIVNNYVLMDTPFYQDAIQAFNRVLKPGGRAIIVILHPCFATPIEADGTRTNQNYFKTQQSYFSDFAFNTYWGTDKFPNHFIEHHRPLSAYWKCFKSNGFQVLDFEEPVFFSERIKMNIPVSVVWHLQKLSKTSNQSTHAQ
jgi:SAM-dependent methyltransferase